MKFYKTTKSNKYEPWGRKRIFSKGNEAIGDLGQPQWVDFYDFAYDIKEDGTYYHISKSELIYERQTEGICVEFTKEEMQDMFNMVEDWLTTYRAKNIPIHDMFLTKLREEKLQRVLK